ncbi:MAG: hypothetical protein IPF66_06885 [Holophagales bacterium]|nr:hypothetical protein [Holophagales bacterium]
MSRCTTASWPSAAALVNVAPPGLPVTSSPAAMNRSSSAASPRPIARSAA